MKIVQILVEAGADVNVGSWPPLCIAVDENNIIIAEYLIDYGANVNAPKGWTALQEAPYIDNNIEMVKLLIANGADINAKTSLGQSPMQLAKPRRNTATIEVLRKYSNEKDGSSVKHDAFFLLPYLCKFMMIFGYASTRSGGKFLRRFLHPFAVLCV